MNQLRDPVEAGLRIRVGFNERRGRFCDPGKKLNRPFRVVLSVTVSSDEMTFDDVQNRP